MTFARAFFIPFILFTQVFPVYCEDIIHIVRNGDTLYSIAKRYKVKVEDILILNNISDSSKIYSGNKIKVPDGTLMAPAISSRGALPLAHKVEKGETLFGLAQKYGVSLKELLAYNNFSENYVLKSGDILKVPALPPPQTAAKSGLPSAGESIAVIPAPTTAIQPKEVPLPVLKPYERASIWPLNIKESSYITSGKLKQGMVLTGEKNESVFSVSSGTVVFAGPYRGYGHIVIVKTSSGYDYFYGGCGKINVRIGDNVSPGLELGKLGVNASTLKPQLTFLVHHKQKSIDPASAPRG